MHFDCPSLQVILEKGLSSWCIFAHAPPTLVFFAEMCTCRRNQGKWGSRILSQVPGSEPMRWKSNCKEGRRVLHLYSGAGDLVDSVCSGGLCPLPGSIFIIWRDTWGWEDLPLSPLALGF